LAELTEVAEIGIGWASVSEIDAINIRNAAFLAMRRAVEALPIAPITCWSMAMPVRRPALRGLADGEGRRAQRVDRGGLHRGQGRAGQGDGGFRRNASRLWLGAPMRAIPRRPIAMRCNIWG
jgi:hypothetical protein